MKMNKKQYNNIIDHTLKHGQSLQTTDSLETARAIFRNMGIALPNGTMSEVYETIKTDNYMGWKSCTMKEAQEAADNGIATIGISEDRIVVISANDAEDFVTAETASVMSLSENTSAYAVSDLQYYSYVYGTTDTTIHCSNSYLSLVQMKSNAQYILNYLRARGWTKNAVCGMLGNMQTESTINPGIWQNLDEGNLNVGFGLVQWTPASKYKTWVDENELPFVNMDSQLKRIFYELQNNIQWYKTSNYPISFLEFALSTQTPSYLAGAFMYNYERPSSYSTLATRQSQATYWYNNLI